ncbi:hypothetical protein ABK040_006844 [Willaertia magna]
MNARTLDSARTNQTGTYSKKNVARTNWPTVKQNDNDYISISSQEDCTKFNSEIQTTTNSNCFITEWTSNHNSLQDFVRTLDKDSIKILCDPNAGGNSIFSEVFSFEFLKQFIESTSKDQLNVTLYKTEMEMEYQEGSKITDYSFRIYNKEKGTEHLLGCSVTRVFDYLDLDNVPQKNLIELLMKKKLSGIIDSTKGIIGDTFERQILHVWTPNRETAEAIQKIYMDYLVTNPELLSNTIIIITVTNQMDFVFKEKGGDALKIAEEVFGTVEDTSNTLLDLEVGLIDFQL